MRKGPKMVNVQCKCGLWFRVAVKKLKWRCPSCGQVNRTQEATEVTDR